jgi:hypothetical protein
VPDCFAIVTVSPLEVAVFPKASSTWTVSTCCDEPSAVSVADVGVSVEASPEPAAGPTAIEGDGAEVASASPAVRAAVSVMFSAFVYSTPVNVTALVPAAIVAVSPVSAPAAPPPSWEASVSVTSVSCGTTAAFPFTSCASTVTLKSPPATADPGTEVTARCVGLPAR